jgi:hypothetical protein
MADLFFDDLTIKTGWEDKTKLVLEGDLRNKAA